MSTVLRRLVTVLGFRINKTGIGDYEKSINSLKKNVYQLDLSFRNLKFAMRGVVFGNVVLSGVALGVAKTVTSLDELSKKVGLSIGNIKALELVSQKTGNSYGELTKTMSGFADKVSKIQNPIIRLNTLQSLMIEKNKKLANVFNQSTNGFKKSIAEVSNLTNVFTQKNIEDSKQYIRNWSEFRTILDEVRNQIGLSYMPVFNELTTKFKGWYLENKEFIKNISTVLSTVLGKSLMILGDIVGSIISPFKTMINLLFEVDKISGVFSKSLEGITIGFQYLLPAILPVSRLVKALSISFLFLSDVIKDITGWMSGLDSVSEKFFGKWENYTKSFSNFSSSLKDATKSFMKTASEFSVAGLFDFKDKEVKIKTINDNVDKKFTNPSLTSPSFYNKNNSSSRNDAKNVNVAPSFSIKIENISVGDNVSSSQAESTALKISEMISKEVDTSFKLMFSDLTNNVTS